MIYHHYYNVVFDAFTDLKLGVVKQEIDSISPICATKQLSVKILN